MEAKIKNKKEYNYKVHTFLAFSRSSYEEDKELHLRLERMDNELKEYENKNKNEY